MTARDELARALHGHMCCENWPDIEHEFNVFPDYREMADAVLSRWLPTLADDAAVVRHLVGVCGNHPAEVRAELRALAAALTPPP